MNEARWQGAVPGQRSCPGLQGHGSGLEVCVPASDLDPQTNATTMLIGEERWRKLNDTGRTLARPFKDALAPNNKQFDFDKALQKGVSDVSPTPSTSCPLVSI